MAPKAAAKGKAAPKAKGKGRQVILNRKMAAPEQVKDATEKTQNILATRAVKKMQRYCRMRKVLSAFDAIRILEDVVLAAPTPGDEALKIILAGPKQEVSDDNVERESAQGGSVRSNNEKLELQEVSSPGGSQATSQGARLTQIPDDEGPSRLTAQVLSERLGQWGVEEPERIAKLIFWLLDVQGTSAGLRSDRESPAYRRPELTAYDLDRVCRHHRKRRRNMNSKVHLFLALVQHGDAEQSYSTRSPTSGCMPKDGARPMTPEGWNQVTRTAWALRLCPTWMPPGTILTAESQCSMDTAERIRLVGEEIEADLTLEPEIALPRSVSAGCLGSAMRQNAPQPRYDQALTKGLGSQPGAPSRNSSKNLGSLGSQPGAPSRSSSKNLGSSQFFPPANICEALDFPRPSALLGPANYYVGETLSSILKKSENPHRNPQNKPKEATPTLIVAGGAMLETLLACLTSGRPREEVLTTRLRGGDAVLLRSHALTQLVGEDANERWRLNSNLWLEGMRRNDWTVLQHIRGDGRKLPVELGGIPTPRKEIPAEFKTRLTAQWNRYAGTALVFSDREYLDFRMRAGFEESTGLGLQPEISRKLRPLVKDYVYTDPPGWLDVSRTGSKASTSRNPSKQGTSRSAARGAMTAISAVRAFAT